MKRLFCAGLALTLGVFAGTAHANPRGSITARILDDKGQPCVGAQITLEPEEHPDAKPYVTETDKAGVFTQEHLMPGKYKLTIKKEGLNPAIGSGLELTKGANKNLGDIKLQAAGAGGSDLVKQATEAAKAGRYDEAITAYNSILEKIATAPEVKPTDLAMIHFNIGLMQEKKQDMAAAEVSYKKAIELDAGLASAYSGLGNIYQAQKKLDDAIALFAKAAEAQPTNGPLIYELGIFYREKGKHEEAYATLEKAAALLPDNPEIQYYLGTSAINLNKIPDAVKYLEKYLAMNPTNKDNVESAKQIIPALKQSATTK
jgi:tetratricopeptide (TPR) repeat protein